VLAPVITQSGPNSASGTAVPGATIRLYRKAESSPGEVQGFLGQASPEGTGQWTVTRNANLANAEFVTANQTTTTNNSSVSQRG
jgi:hypothetical protein